MNLYIYIKGGLGGRGVLNVGSRGYDSIGRGRGATMPAWMTNNKDNTSKIISKDKIKKHLKKNHKKKESKKKKSKKKKHKKKSHKKRKKSRKYTSSSDSDSSRFAMKLQTFYNIDLCE